MVKIAVNVIFNPQNNSSNEATKKLAKAVFSYHIISNNWLNYVNPPGLEPNIDENMILKTIQFLTYEVVKFPHMVKKISFLPGMLFNQEILEFFHRKYFENKNVFMQNASLPPAFSDNNLSDISGFVLSNEYQNSFRQLPKKLTFIIIVKYIKEWFTQKQTSPLKKFMEAFKMRMKKLVDRKKKKSAFSNEPTDCTNEFIYICSKSKSINCLLLNRS